MNRTSITFEGYQDSAGSAGETRALASKRVDAVYGYLVASFKQQGVSAGTLKSIGLGSGRPVASAIEKVPSSRSTSVGLMVDYLL